MIKKNSSHELHTTIFVNVFTISIKEYGRWTVKLRESSFLTMLSVLVPRRQLIIYHTRNVVNPTMHACLFDKS